MLLQVFRICGVMGCRKQSGMFHGGQHVPVHRVDLGDPVDFVSEHFHPQCAFFFARRNNLNHITAHTEGTALKIRIIPLVLNIYQVPQQLLPRRGHAGPQAEHLSFVFAGVSHGIDAAD